MRSAAAGESAEEAARPAKVARGEGRHASEMKTATPCVTHTHDDDDDDDDD